MISLLWVRLQSSWLFGGIKVRFMHVRVAIHDLIKSFDAWVRSRISGHAGPACRMVRARPSFGGAALSFPATPLHQMKLFRNVPGVTWRNIPRGQVLALPTTEEKQHQIFGLFPVSLTRDDNWPRGFSVSLVQFNRLTSSQG